MSLPGHTMKHCSLAPSNSEGTKYSVFFKYVLDQIKCQLLKTVCGVSSASQIISLHCEISIDSKQNVASSMKTPADNSAIQA